MTLKIDQAIDIIRAAAADGLSRAAEMVLDESNKRVPIEDGDLRRSGKASEDREALAAAVSYDTDYAVIQHERIKYRHDAGRSFKFLEQAATSNAARAGQIIADTIRQRVGD